MSKKLPPFITVNGEVYSRIAIAKPVQYKGATYLPVDSAGKTVQHKGATYRRVEADRLPEHVQEFLRKKKQQGLMQELLEDIQHVTPHRKKSYDPSKVRMRSDEEQETYEKTQHEVSRLKALQRREQKEEAPEVEEEEYVSPEEMEVIEFGEEAPLPHQERMDTPREKFGPSLEENMHIRVSDNDYRFLSQVPGMKRSQDTSKFLRNIQRGQKRERNEVWVSEQQLESTVKALQNLIDDPELGDAERTIAQDLKSRYDRLVNPPKPKTTKMPSYESKPREEGNIRMFSYRGATVRRRVRR